MADSVSSLYRRSADTFTVSSFILTHSGPLIVCRAANVLTRTTASDRHESWTRSSTFQQGSSTMSHVIRYSARRRERTNRMISTPLLQRLKERPGNYVRNLGAREYRRLGRRQKQDEASQTWARSVTSAFVRSTRSRGLSSTLRPRRPPETIMVSWSRHAESMNSRCEVVCPSGLMPPTT